MGTGFFFVSVKFFTVGEFALNAFRKWYKNSTLSAKTSLKSVCSSQNKCGNKTETDLAQLLYNVVLNRLQVTVFQNNVLVQLILVPFQIKDKGFSAEGQMQMFVSWTCLLYLRAMICKEFFLTASWINTSL